MSMQKEEKRNVLHYVLALVERLNLLEQIAQVINTMTKGILIGCHGSSVLSSLLLVEG